MAVASVPAPAQPPHVRRVQYEPDLQKVREERYREQRMADHKRDRKYRKARDEAHKAPAYRGKAAGKSDNRPTEAHQLAGPARLLLGCGGYTI